MKKIKCTCGHMLQQFQPKNKAQYWYECRYCGRKTPTMKTYEAARAEAIKKVGVKQNEI